MKKITRHTLPNDRPQTVRDFAMIFALHPSDAEIKVVMRFNQRVNYVEIIQPDEDEDVIVEGEVVS